MERETRFELATSTLARLHSTTELLPHFQVRRHYIYPIQLVNTSLFFSVDHLFLRNEDNMSKDIFEVYSASDWQYLPNDGLCTAKLNIWLKRGFVCHREALLLAT